MCHTPAVFFAAQMRRPPPADSNGGPRSRGTSHSRLGIGKKEAHTFHATSCYDYRVETLICATLSSPPLCSSSTSSSSSPSTTLFVPFSLSSLITGSTRTSSGCSPTSKSSTASLQPEYLCTICCFPQAFGQQYMEAARITWKFSRLHKYRVSQEQRVGGTVLKLRAQPPDSQYWHPLNPSPPLRRQRAPVGLPPSYP